MSSIIAPESTAFSQQLTEADGGLQVVGEQSEANIIEIKGDAEIGIVGGNLADTITTGAGDATVFAGDGDDMIMGGIGNDILRGGEGNDTIKGGPGDDTILGGAGDDVIKGGIGSDLLKGGEGNDIFEFAARDFEGGEMDEIVDFEAGELADVIKIFGAGIGADTAVAYNPDTGMVSVDGQDIVDIGEGLDVEANLNENDNWELF